MSGELTVEIVPDPSNPQGVVLQVALKDVRSGMSVTLLPACRSMEELRRGFDEIRVGVDKAFAEGEKKLDAALKEGKAAKEVSPGEAWKKMELLSTEEEMFAYFNSFSERKRQEIAEYVFSHANMFKGRGPVFSEHYDTSSHLLE